MMGSSFPVIGRVGPCDAWPSGAWAVQLSIPPALNYLAAGRYQLDIKLVTKTTRPDSNGDYDYEIIVAQEDLIPTPHTEELGKYVTAEAGLGDDCLPVDFLEGVRRVAHIRRCDLHGNTRRRERLESVA